jgi:transposase InsO family protein
VLDDFSRFIVAWKLCATMRAEDVTATLDLALAAAGLESVTVVHRPRLLSDNGASYISADLAEWLLGSVHDHPAAHHGRGRSWFSLPYDFVGWLPSLKGIVIGP